MTHPILIEKKDYFNLLKAVVELTSLSDDMKIRNAALESVNKIGSQLPFENPEPTLAGNSPSAIIVDEQIENNFVEIAQKSGGTVFGKFENGNLIIK